MHAFLIVGQNQQEIDQEVTKLTEKLTSKVTPFQLTKIGDVRELSKFTKLSQVAPTSILISNLHTASVEALNAFLKNLEEPQQNISYILTSDNEHAVLETIRSRCQIIHTKTKSDAGDFSKVEQFLSGSLSKRFTLADTMKTRDSAIEFIETLLQFLHTTLKNTDSNPIEQKGNIKEAQKTLSALQANGNIRLHLSRLAIKLS